MHQSTIYTEPFDIATAFNNYFHSVFTHSSYQIPPIDHLPVSSTQISSLKIDESEVFNALVTINPRKSSGTDDINNTILVECADILTGPLRNLFQLSLDTATLPNEWKVHKIVPIPKNNDVTKVVNYRPISLLCVTSKLLESIIFTKIIGFIRRQLSKRQFGFLKRRSCLTQLLKSYYEISLVLDRGCPVDAIFLDFAKAFDSVPHNELLLKLWRFGIHGPLWLWFKAYLTNRWQYVEIDGCRSNQLSVISGVPQGSILGPLLFLIYINDLPDHIHHSSMYLFADDTKFLSAVSDYSIDNLQRDMNDVSTWCTVWKLQINVSKSVSVRFSFGHPTHDLHYSHINTPIPTHTSHRDLGIIVTSNLSWNEHIKSICSKAYRNLNFIRRNLHQSSDLQVRRTVYLSLVRSQLSYCSQLWRPHLIKNIKALEDIQRRSTKFILSYPQLDYKNRLITLNLLPVMYWLELQDVLFLIKCIKFPSDNFNIFDYISFNNTCTRHHTNHKLQHRYCRTTAMRHFYFVRIVRLWNSLPFIDLNNSFSTIKRYLYSYFWNHFIQYFDSVNICTFHFKCPCNSCN